MLRSKNGLNRVHYSIPDGCFVIQEWRESEKTGRLGWFSGLKVESVILEDAKPWISKASVKTIQRTGKRNVVMGIEGKVTSLDYDEAFSLVESSRLVRCNPTIRDNFWYADTDEEYQASNKAVFIRKEGDERGRMYA